MATWFCIPKCAILRINKSLEEVKTARLTLRKHKSCMELDEKYFKIAEKRITDVKY